MIKIYSPIQIGLGSFLGGPFAAIYFLKVNFDALGKKEFSKNTLLIGLTASFLLIISSPIIPDEMPPMLFTTLFLLLVIMVVFHHQISKKEIRNSQDYDFQSNWKVFGMSIAWLIPYMVIILLYQYALNPEAFNSLVHEFS